MARVSQQILPYWQFEVGLLDDIKVVDLVDKYGSLGFMILCAIYSIATNSNGYYAEINDQLTLSIYRTIGSKWIKRRSVVSEVIDYCGVCGLFDVNLLSQNVITSRGMQRRWLYVKNKSRAKGYSTAKYWLLDDEPVQDILCDNENRCSNNDDKCNINSDKCNINSDIKRREDKRIEEKIREDSAVACLRPFVEINCELELDEACYEKIAKEFALSDWLKANIKTLTSVHRIKDKILQGYYRTSNAAKPATATTAFIKREYSEDELNAVYDRKNNEDF